MDICWLEVLGAAVAAFGEVELLGDMAGMWVWKGKVSRCSDPRLSAVGPEIIAVLGPDYLRLSFPFGPHYLRMSPHWLRRTHLVESARVICMTVTKLGLPFSDSAL